MAQAHKRIIFFTEYPFNKWDYDRLGIEILQSKGLEVEVWDLTPIIRPEAYRMIKITALADFNGLRRFFDRKEICASLKGVREGSLIISLLPYTLDTAWVFREISARRIPYSVVIANAIPFSSREIKNGFLKKIAKELPGLKLSGLPRRLFPYVPHRLIGIDPVSYIMAGGKKSLLSLKYPYDHARSRILWLHAFDYDVYIKEGLRAGIKNDGTAVFLDEYLPFHSDYLYAGGRPFTTAQEYYPYLCRFFARIENAAGVKVVIAAHPRSRYEEHPDYFGGRQIIKGKTAQLVRDSNFVIAHVSTAINYAVLFKKPVIFVSTDSVNASPSGPWVEMFSVLLNKKSINLCSDYRLDLEKELAVDQERYEEYKKDFIKNAGPEGVLFWDLFSQKIKEI